MMCTIIDNSIHAYNLLGYTLSSFQLKALKNAVLHFSSDGFREVTSCSQEITIENI